MALLNVGTSPKVLKDCGDHMHPFYEIILNLEGEGITIVGGHQLPFCPGSIELIPKNVPHRKQSQEGFRDIYIKTDVLPDAMVRAFEQGIPIFEDDYNKTMTSLIKMMLCRYLVSNKEDVVLQTMYDLFLKLLEEKCTVSQYDPVIEGICHKLALYYNDPELQLSKILESTGYNKDHIRRKFISAYGVTPGEYLINLRIENAKKLLRNRKNTHQSIADIGADCGYYDGHYFSRIFKRRVGVTPERFAAEHTAK